MLTFGWFYTYLFIPEVKGLSLEEVDELYRAGVKPWRSSAWRPADKHLHHHRKGEELHVGEDSVDVHEEKGKD